MSDPFFDTNIIIDWLFNRAPAITELARYGKHRISRIVWTEIIAAEPVQQRATLQHLLARFETVEIDQRVAAAAADIRFRTHMELMDAFILATAQLNGAILVTRNTRDFPANMPGIRVPYTL